MMVLRGVHVGDVEKQLRQTFQVPEETECRVWHRYMTSTYELLSNRDSSLQDVGLYSGQVSVWVVREGGSACVRVCMREGGRERRERGRKGDCIV